MRSRSSSCWLLLASVSAIFGQPAAPPAPASVAGEVRNAVTGEPIERAHVVVERGSGNSRERYGVLTNAEGKFVIAGLTPAPYIVTLDRVGFVGSPNPVEGSFELHAGEKKENVKL